MTEQLCCGKVKATPALKHSIKSIFQTTELMLRMFEVTDEIDIAHFEFFINEYFFEMSRIKTANAEKIPAPDEIRAMSGDELKRQVAKHIMGWRQVGNGWKAPWGELACEIEIPDYDTSIAHAFDVLSEMEKLGYTWTMQKYVMDISLKRGGAEFTGTGSTQPVAILRACLLAKLHGKDAE